MCGKANSVSCGSKLRMPEEGSGAWGDEDLGESRASCGTWIGRDIASCNCIGVQVVARTATARASMVSVYGITVAAAELRKLFRSSLRVLQLCLIRGALLSQPQVTGTE